MRLRVGNRVKVNENSGTHSGKEGVLIPKSFIPVNEYGIPQLPGCCNILQAHEVGVQQSDGSIFIVYMDRLTKTSDD